MDSLAMSEDKVIRLVKDLVKAYLEVKSEIERVKSEVVRNILDVLDLINFRRLLKEALQEELEHR